MAELRDAESGHEVHQTLIDHLAGTRAERGALREFIAEPTTEDIRGAPATRHPRDLGAGRSPGQFAQAQHGMRGGVPRTHDHNMRPRELGHVVRNAIRDRGRRRRLAERRESIATSGVRKPPAIAADTG
ncbi:hypothetical protein GCM10007198_05940 [Microbacterium aerolatum]|uniref:Uncharacterized protein n=1 Tax=Microbacterium aerolatum TaxID=153731 RepID=A0A511AEL2_9MICO|nr:hypothetical protein MAE01_17760 [Microbacterium aerolatum]GGB18213.1 hypothetical protein GCM10007198_05940 [Microbacterium aerolatum]